MSDYVNGVNMSTVLAVDPGSSKCGLAVLDDSGSVLFKKVLPTSSISEEITPLLTSFSPLCVIIGNGTCFKRLKEQLLELCKLPICTIDEKHTTEEARKRYFVENPPRGLAKLIPKGMLLPPVPYDDYAAILLAERYFKIPKEELKWLRK